MEFEKLSGKSLGDLCIDVFFPHTYFEKYQI